MNIVFTFKNFEPSDHLKQYARKRLEKLGRFVSSPESVEIAVLLTVDKFRQRAEVRMTGDHLDISAMEQSEDMYATIDMVLDKLSSQLKRQQEKQKDHRRQAEASRMVQMDVFQFDENEGKERKIVTSNKFAPKPMTVEEAAHQLEAGSQKQTFIVFLNAMTDRVNVLHKMPNGDFGLIDPEA